MAVTLTWNNLATVAEQFTLGMEHVSNPTVKHESTLVVNGTLNATSTPKSELAWSDKRLVSDGDLDLSALGGGTGDFANRTVDFNGKAIQYCRITALSTNGADIIFSKAAVEGYEIFTLAGTTPTIGVKPGASVVFYLDGQLAVIVSDTNDKITVTGTAGDTYEVVLVAGANS